MAKQLGVHLKDASIEFESRVMKITSSVVKSGVVSNVVIIGKLRNGLDSIEWIDDNRIINRISTPLQMLMGFGFLKKPIIFRRIVAFGSIIFFHVSILFRLLKIKNIRYVCIHNPELLLVGYIFKLMKGGNIFYSPHELEPHKQSVGKVRRLFIRFIEPRLIHLMNASVFVVSENIADWYAKEYCIDRPVVVKNAPRLMDIKETNHFRENLGIKAESIIVLYQGGFTKGRGVEFLLEAFKKRIDENIVIVFMGYGDLEDDIRKSSEEYDNIFFHPAVAPEIVLEYTSSADIGISFFENTCLSHYYVLPNKLFEYAMVGLPVIVSNMKEMRELVESYDMGIIVEEVNIDAMNRAIDTILDINLYEMKQNARRCAEENSWETQEIRLINTFKIKLDGK
jgi:glycosyltransferase involved in cell wall biosynthesis